MGWNVGGIHVQMRPQLTQEDIRDFVADYWCALGAQLSEKDPLAFEPLDVSDSGDLGFVITAPGRAEGPARGKGKGKGKGKAAPRGMWVAVYDSERYCADDELAKALAKHFCTDVWHWEIAEVANMASATRFGPGPTKKVRSFGKVVDLVFRLPDGGLYYDHLQYEPEDLEGMLLVSLEGVPYRRGTDYSGPRKKR